MNTNKSTNMNESTNVYEGEFESLGDCTVAVVNNDSRNDPTWFGQEDTFLYFYTGDLENVAALEDSTHPENEGKLIRSVKLSDVLAFLSEHNLLDKLPHTDRCLREFSCEYESKSEVIHDEGEEPEDEYSWIGDQID